MHEHHEQLLRQAAILHAQGRRQEAIAIFRQVLADLPGSSEGWYELGTAQGRGSIREALHAYGEAWRWASGGRKK